MQGPTPKEQRQIERARALLKNSWPHLKGVLVIAVSTIIGNIIFWSMFNWSADETVQSASFSSAEWLADTNCSVAGIKLRGDLVSYIPSHSENDQSFSQDVMSSEDLVVAIRQASEDSEIQAILVEVNSYGGAAVAAEEISSAIENSTKPVVALIREAGTSAAYWAISGAGKVFASKNSDVGGIGVTISHLNNVAKNQKEGYVYEQLSVGRFKDYGSPDKPITREERALFMRDLNIVYVNFVEAVAKNRNLSVEKVKSFADGSSVLGEQAKAMGLIDEIGGINEAENYLKEIIGEKPVVCWR